MTVQTPNPYLEQVVQTLPRLLGMYDTDPTSPSFGWGDRFHWSWKLIDFGNATFQGAAHGLARLLKARMLPPHLSPDTIKCRIWAMLDGAKRLVRPDGSLEEAFPYEHSFCVTALVAFDLLHALECLGREGDPGNYDSGLEVIRPMIGFLKKADETHAFISNHLATAVGALAKWHVLTGDIEAEKRGKMFLDRIIAHQSSEGWFQEYEGFDPGYQTLCIYYLAEVHRMKPEWGLLAPLRNAIIHLSYFAHPDGSFGGVYGSRNTRFFIPGGLEWLSQEIPEAAILCAFMRHSIANLHCVSLIGLDAPNLVPVFNSYCWAAVVLATSNHPPTSGNLPSMMTQGVWRKRFDEAGLFIDKGENHYTIVSWHKGGIVFHYNRNTGKAHWNTGLIAKNTQEEYYSTQVYEKKNSCHLDGDQITVEAGLFRMQKKIPQPWQFWILRFLNMTVMRIHFLAEMIKKLLVYMLITGKHASRYRNKRQIHLGVDLKIEDQVEPQSPELKTVNQHGIFYAIHMASQGYWQKQDDIL